MKKFAIIFTVLSCMVFSQNPDKTSKPSKAPVEKVDTTMGNQPMNTPGCPVDVPCQQAVANTACCCPCCPIGLSIAFKPGYFWQQEEIYRDIYGTGYISLLEVCYDPCWYGLGLFGEVGYFFKDAHVTSVDIVADTDVSHVPLTIGLSYTFEATCWLDIYLKIGPNWVWTKTWVDIPGLQKTVVKNTFGGTVGAGLKFDLTCGWFLELYANYLYDRKTIHDHVANETFKRYLGGIQTGAGLGYRF